MAQGEGTGSGLGDGRVWGQESRRLGPKDGGVLPFGPTWVPSLLEMLFIQNPVALNHVPHFAIIYNVEGKIESHFQNMAFVRLVDFSGTA